MQMKKILCLIIFLIQAVGAYAQSGTMGDPFTSLHQGAAVTTAGIYYFNIGGTTFDTHIDANGYVQVAIDFGNGTGNLPQGTSLTTAARGILNTTVLAALTETQEVRISSSTGNFDVTTTDATIISRVQSNTTLHQGTADNAINNTWTGTNSSYITDNASCTTPDGIVLHENIVHTCGNTAGYIWTPANSVQREQFSSGEIANAEFFQLWVKGNATCTTILTSLNQATGITSAGQYCFNIGGNLFETYVDANGYVQVAIDFGNGTGNLPQGDILTNTTRGILNTTILAALTEIQEVRISSSTGNFDVTTSDVTIISRVQSNTTLHQGTADNLINDAWTGTNATYMTDDASCTTPDGTVLNENIVHTCGNTAGYIWTPANSVQREQFSSGEIANAEFFQLWVKGSVVLPIELSNFRAIVINDEQVNLTWQTASEINNDYFTIERSSDAVNWEMVEKVDGAGNSNSALNYSLVDKTPYCGTSYYRLKQTDFDGRFSFSEIISITLRDSHNFKMYVYPNPANSILTIEANELALKDIQIYDPSGHNVTQYIKLLTKGNNMLVIDLSQLSAGFYYIKARNSVRKMYKR